MAQIPNCFGYRTDVIDPVVQNDDQSCLPLVELELLEGVSLVA